MPDLDTDDQLDVDSDVEDTDGADEETDEAGAAGDEGSESDNDSPADKRIRDLQSKADKAEARANRLEKLLAKAAGSGEGNASGSKDPERDALMTELREASLDAVFGEFPELTTYGIDRSLIEGRTRAEMREAATSLVGLIKSVETKARNKALRDAGVKADPTGATRQPPKNYATMSDEDFEKEIARARGGGVLGII